MPDLDNELMDAVDPEGEQETPAPAQPKKISFVKVGIPVLLVQIILAYFLASHFLVPRLYGEPTPAEAEVAEKPEEPQFGKIFRLEDLIVNPAESRGMQFVLVNFGFEVKEDADVEMLKQREVQLRDLLINIMGAKTLAELDGPQDKELLRREIKERLVGLVPSGHILNVYFSNYIIQ
ncbi:MAG: flagellar basal body-associated FliL family protein [Calditrichia bacterium]